MAKAEYSDYQRQTINNYYQNLDAIMLQKLGELVTELYIAETPAATRHLWDRAEKAMRKLKIAPAVIEHIIRSSKPEILAGNLQDWLTGKGKK